MSDSEINENIKGVFESIVEVLETKGVQKEGNVWITLCEVVLHVAKRVSSLTLARLLS